jgi:hypothetical protein
MKRIKLLSLVVLFSFKTFADEGMWLPFLLENLNEKEMKAMGLKITAKDIYDINKGSLKDAIVQFGGGCTGEIISNKGLILTNHHCGFGNIQRLSTLENNYVTNGYWSKGFNEELPAAGLTVTFISRMENVTKIILNGVTTTMSEPERQSTIDKNIKAYQTTVNKKSFENIIVRPFYNGNMYIMIATIVYKDIRFVGAPPESIGAYGHDTDNWVWPRHAADFSLFRIYANDKNEPVEYSPNNVPYTPKKSLNISLDGVKEGDFTMVYGFPGRTNQYLPGIAVEQTLKLNNPIKIEIRDEVLKIQKSFMQNDDKIKLQYASKYAGIANAWKKWIGENLGLEKSKAVDRKLAYEKIFIQKVNANAVWKSIYGNTLNQLNALYKEAEPYFYVRDAFNEVFNNCEVLGNGAQLAVLEKALETGNVATIDKEKAALQTRMTNFYKDYNTAVDEQVLAKVVEIFFARVNKTYWGVTSTQLWEQYKADAKALAKDVFVNSFLVNEDKLKTFVAIPNTELLKALREDKGYQLAAALRNGYIDNAADKVTSLQTEINKIQRQYMEAQLLVMQKDRKFYPDANSSLRLTYGKVKGYQPKDGMSYHYYTYLDGVMEKYIPNDYEFDVPQKLRDLHQAKDYGQYGENGKQPVCFIAANHTTGGNSGSPALDAYGNLVGLNFDRVWEGTMSDINYDVSICRNIMVDARYVLFIIDKFGGATHLIKEMNLVHPKKKK